MAFVWTDEMVATLTKAIDAGEIPYATAEALAQELKVSTRSLAAKARVLGGTVAKKESTAAAKWTQDEADTLVQYIQAGHTDVEIAELMGKTNKQIRGKALSLGIVSDLKIVKKEVVEVPKTFTEDEAATIAKMAAEGKFIEDIAEALGKTKNQVRGKALSMKLKIPQKEHKEASKTKIYTDEVSAKVAELVKAGKTAEEIAEQLELKVAGLKSHIGKLGLKTADMAVKSNKYSEEDIATITRMANAGKSIEDVAEAIGRTVQSVRVVAGRNKVQFAKAA